MEPVDRTHAHTFSCLERAYQVSARVPQWFQATSGRSGVYVLEEIDDRSECLYPFLSLNVSWEIQVTVTRRVRRSEHRDWRQAL